MLGIEVSGEVLVTMQEAPDWFRRAIDTKPEHHDVDVAGVAVHYRAWGPAGAPGVVLIHGGGAHAGWWDHIGPLLAAEHRVIAPDLTGHGDSGWKPEYVRSRWADETVELTAAAGLDKPVLIGHSMGGWVALFAGVLYPDAMRSIVAIDSPLNDEPPEEEPMRRNRPGPVTKVYASREDAVARFRTVPAQDTMLPYVAEHIAIESLRPVEGGWTWKFDPAVFGDRTWHRDLLPQQTVPTTLLRCENGLVTAPMAAKMSTLPKAGMPVIDLPDTGHHAMFDQPLALVAALRTLLVVSA